ncbi:MAG TPA: LLM class flavin-dependent oxidoreductase [Pseudonocardiaceae bacterium]|nr:LLM class flavin-dependent oxidoreductase [Pseudonocardiaceae bacterium]
MTVTGLGAVISSRAPLSDVYDQVGLLEAFGYTSVWVPEMTGRDAFVTATAIGMHSATITVVSGVASLALRHPILLGMQTAATEEAIGGRFVLGLGAGHAETSAGGLTVDAVPGPTELRAAVAALRSMLDRSRTEPHRLRGVYLDGPPPIVLAAVSERAAALAGEVADGMILNWITPQRARVLADTAREAAAAVGRDPDRFTVAAYVPVAVTEQVAGAEHQVARQLAAYARLRSYRRGFARSGFPVDDTFPTADTVAALSAIGDIGFVTRRLDEFRAAGITLPVLAPVLGAAGEGWASLIATWSALAPGNTPGNTPGNED